MPARPPTATAETTYFVNRDSRGRRAEVASNPRDPTSMPAHVESVRPSGIRRDADQLADHGRVPGHVRLTEADLGRRILDCPGGTASFTAEVNAAGGDAIACDAIYPQYAPNVGERHRTGQRLCACPSRAVPVELLRPFHRAAIGGLMRVARDELRIFPLVAMGSALLYPLVDELESDAGLPARQEPRGPGG